MLREQVSPGVHHVHPERDQASLCLRVEPRIEMPHEIRRRFEVIPDNKASGHGNAREGGGGRGDISTSIRRVTCVRQDAREGRGGKRSSATCARGEREHRRSLATDRGKLSKTKPERGYLELPNRAVQKPQNSFGKNTIVTK